MNNVLKIFFTTILLISTAAYSFSFVDINNKTHNKKDLLGKFIVVNFWATWCPPCLREMPDLVELYEDYGNQVEILGINYWDDVSDKNITDFMELYFINYPIIREKNNEKTIAQFGVLRGLPTTFIYDKQGKLLTKIEREVSFDILKKIMSLK